ncbi:MAG: hypothetical protein ABFS43_11245 [Thermodesulfobacteriota bacterium]
MPVKSKILVLVFTYLLLCLSSSVVAEETKAPADSVTDPISDETMPFAEQDAEKEKGRLGITPFPVIYYTPETSLALGGGVVFTLRDEGDSLETRPDNLQVMTAYTLNNQFFLNLAPEKYFNDQRGRLFMNIGYLNWPTSFFGIGNDSGIDVGEIEELEETYTDESFMLQPWVVHEVVADLSMGLTLDWKNTHVEDVEEGGQLEQGDLVGSEGGVRSGMGPVITWDTRDNLFAPSRGSWFNAWAWLYREWMGSDFDYDYYGLDLRHYRSIGRESVLALQGFMALTSGDVPFNEYPTPLMRGLYENVFTDKNAAAVRAEYRFPIKGRWGAAVFGAVGDAFPDATTTEEIDLKVAGGVGMRFALNKQEKINIRLDIGVSRYGIFPYVMLQEAF